jgi:NTE family protein
MEIAERLTEVPAGGSAQRRVAVVVGSGAVKCAAALGMWKVLRREGIAVDTYVGCSGGCLYTAAMALDFEFERAERLTHQLWRREVTARRDLRSILSIFMPRLFPFAGHFGLLSDESVVRALDEVFGDARFEDCVVPAHMVATDLHNGERVVISSGRMADAVRASIALPYIWSPWKVGDRWLLDGCMSDPLPVDVAIREGADVVLAMGFEAAYPRRIRNASRYAFQVNSIYTNNLLRANYAFHSLAHHDEILLILPDFQGPVGLFDTERIAEVIAAGERATEAQLPYLERVLATPA